MRARRDERGSILVLALLVSLILLAFGLTVMWVASSAQRASTNISRRQEAMYAAEAGVEQARAILSGLNDWNGVLGWSSPNNWLCACPNSDQLRGCILRDGAGTCLQNMQVVDLGSASWAAQNAADPTLKNYSYTIWVRNDWEDECDPTTAHPITNCNADCYWGDTLTGTGCGYTMHDINGRIVVLVEGVARDGLSSVRLQIVLARTPAMNTSMGGYEGQKGFSGQGPSALMGHTIGLP
jgi:Tfp pilus assembly protein PilX